MGEKGTKKGALYFDKPAKEWGEAFLLGDGTLGAAIFGGERQERIILSHNTFFSGEKEHIKRDNAPKAFKKMRHHLQHNRYKEAVESSSEFIGIQGNYGTNLPVGDILIDFESKQKNIKQQYDRNLNIYQGVVKIRAQESDGYIKRECFIFHKDHGLYYKIEASEPIKAWLRFENTDIKNTTFVKEQQYYFALQALEKIHSDGKTGVSLMGKVHVIELDGDVRYTDKGIYVDDFTHCVFRLVTETDFDLEAECLISEIDRRKLALIPLELEYSQIISEHKTDVEGYMQRLDISFGGKDDLSEFMLQYGRYLLLSSSREDSQLPAHLQGIWNDNVACNIGWTCDMHLDINTQMNYWLSEAGNLGECHKPLLTWMKNCLLPSGRKTAKDYYGLQGWSADLVSNAWGYTHPYWSSTISPCPTSGIWIAADFVDHYKYSPNDAFLEKEAFPVIEEAVAFFVDYVFKSDQGYSVGPSISPENSYLIDGERYFFLLDSTYERLMIYELFNQYLYLCKERQRMGKYTQKVEVIISDFDVYTVTADGRIREFSENAEEYDSQHRHTSHLLGLYPYHHIRPDKTPQWAKAAYKSIQKRLSPYNQWEDTGWARTMLMLYMARLKKGNEAYWHIEQMYDNLLNPNRLVIHPPTRGANAFANVYELDGNTGLAMGIIEMLIQSKPEYIEILPALPMIWSEGYAKGLKAYGGVTVSIEWENSQLKQVTLEAGKEGWIRFLHRKKIEKVYLLKGEKQIIKYN